MGLTVGYADLPEGFCALINLMMASRLLYRMSRQAILPPFLSNVHPIRQTPGASILFTAAIALALTTYVSLDPKNPIVSMLGGTTSLLLLTVFAVVNVAVLVLRRNPVDHKHFRTPTFLPFAGVLTCIYLVLPWTSGRPIEQYQNAGFLLATGVVLWLITWAVNRRIRATPTKITQVEDLV